MSVRVDARRFQCHTSAFVKALLKQFEKVRVLVIGDLLADHYLSGQTERVSREAPVLIVRHEFDEVKLGGGANAAANARALGAKVSAIGVLGKDLIGEQMVELFTAQGIRCAAVRNHGVVTETRTRILAGGVSTTRQQMLRIDRGAVGPLSPAAQQALARSLLTLGRSADVIMVSDYGAGVLNDVTRAALRTLAASVPVSVDSRFSLRAFQGMTICKPNEPELAALAGGLPVHTDAEVIAAGSLVRASLKCRILLVTRGRKGMALFEQGKKPRLIEVFGSDEAVDVTGAGDTVCAAFSLAIGAGASAQEAAQLANIAGALVVQKEGTATVSRAELEAQLP